MKKLLVMAVALLAVLGGVFLLGSGEGTKIILRNPSEGEVTYTYGGVSFTEELTPDEIKAVAAILNGKTYDMSTGMPSCGFNRDIAIIIDGNWFMLACDQCGIVQHGTNFISISDGERAVLEEIFTSRGGKFPCV